MDGGVAPDGRPSYRTRQAGLACAGASLVARGARATDGTTTGDLVTWCWPVLVRGLPTAAR